MRFLRTFRPPGPRCPPRSPANSRSAPRHLAISQVVLAAVLLLSISRIHSQLVLDDLTDYDELMQVLLARSYAAAGAPAPMPPWLLEAHPLERANRLRVYGGSAAAAAAAAAAGHGPYDQAPTVGRG
jgi:hypothetical protein